MTALFVTGTDRDVGKTIVSRALVQALTAQGQRAVSYTPLALSAAARGLAASMAQSEEAQPLLVLDGEEIYAHPPEPALFERFSAGLAAREALADSVVVEGCGGWRLMLDETRCYADWVRAQQLPVVLVVGIKQGCISHALLTAEAIVRDGLPLVGWVANRINPCLAHYAETIHLLSRNIDAPLLGEIPYLPHAERRELGHLLDLSRLAVPR